MPHHKSMVADDFTVPLRLETDRFVLRPLLHSDAQLDYEAWASSIEHLQGIFGPESTWPTSEMTLEENAIDLAWHQREFETGSAFAYAVLNAAETQSLGCVYMYPAQKVGNEVDAYYWVRASELANGLDEALGAFFRKWLADIWHFNSVSYPGRDIDWETHNALPDQPHW